MTDADPATLPTGLRPFIPSENFEKSRDFYEELGFIVKFADSDIAIMQNGPIQIILQNFYHKSFAENLMIQMTVRDIDAWWSERRPEQLAQKFGIRDPKPPVMQSWGFKIEYIFDPCGVLWHIAELE